MTTAVNVTQEGFEILCLWARNIAMLPLEDWDEALEHAESVGAVLDPTLYRQYLYSEKAKVLRDLIRAAIPLKNVVMGAQDLIRKELGIDVSASGKKED